MKTDPSKNTIQHLAESKGWTMDYTKSTINYVVNMAKEVGLNYDFEHAVVANSFDAHRLIQFAKSKGKGDAAEERLFKAYFTEGKNTADHSVLLSIAKEIGLDEAEAKAVLESQQFADQVKHDIAESEQLGVTGVPFFVIDRKYAVSGAQDSQVFLDSLNKAWAQFQR
jgi:predicted DsbA family dithiol-disulfide isomerase